MMKELEVLRFQVYKQNEALEKKEKALEEKEKALEEAKARSEEKRRKIAELKAASVGKRDALLLSPHKPNLLTKRSSAQKVKRALFTNTKR